MKTRTTFALALFLALAQPGARPVAAGNIAAPPPQTMPIASTSQPASEGEVALTLTKTPDIGYFVHFTDGTHSELYSSCLQSIDGKSLRGMDLNQITALLRGPVGSTATLEFLDEDGQAKSVSARREAKAAAVDNRVNILLQASDGLDRADPRIANIDFLKDKLDICARAGQNLLLQQTEEWPSPKGNLVAIAALSAALTDYETGNLPQGDHFMEQVEKAYVENEPMVCPPERLPTDIIKMLLTVGRPDDAEKLAYRLFENRHSGVVLDLDQIACFKILAESQSKTDKAKALKTAALIEALEKNVMRQEDSEWLADFNLRQGNLSRSMELYKKASAARAQTVTKGRWQALQPLMMDLYQTALLYTANGQRDEAERALQTAREKYKSMLPESEIAALESAPLLFPRLSDLDKLPQVVDNRQSSLSAIAATRQYEGGEKSHVEEVYSQVRTFYKSVKSGQEAKAGACAEQLLKIYSNSNNNNNTLTSGSGTRQLKLACILACLARRLSDAGWYNSSNALLAKLVGNAEKQPEPYVYLVYLNTELVANAVRTKIATAETWKTFESNYSLRSQLRRAENQPLNQTNHDYTWSERLRRLAMTYYFAGELERAKILIDQAVTEESRTAEVDWMDVIEAPFAQNNNKLLFPDAALIALKQGNAVDTEKFFQLVRFSTSLSEPACIGAVSQLAKCLASSNRSGEAIELLKNTRGAMRAHNLQFSDKPNAYAIATQVDYPLAYLLFYKGKDKNPIFDEKKPMLDPPPVKKSESLIILDEAIANITHDASPAMLSLAASCAASDKDYESAARYCKLAAQTDDYGPMRVKTGDLFIPAMLDKGLQFANQLPQLDKAKARSLLIELAEIAGTGRPMESLKLYQNAQALTPEMSPQRAVLQTKIDALVQLMQ